MKIVIANLDIDDPAETTEISAVELDLAGPGDVVAPRSPQLAKNIAKVAASSTEAMVAEQRRATNRLAQNAATERFKALKVELKQEFGLSVAVGEPRVYTPKPQAAYDLWKRVIPMFAERVGMLDVGPTQLAKQLNRTDAEFVATRDMIYDPLSALAKKDLARLLEKLGIAIVLPKGKVSIRSVQQQFIARRDATLDLAVEEFVAKVKIQGDTAFVNGKPYKIQIGASGKRRIKRGGRDWLALDTLRAFCTPPR